MKKLRIKDLDDINTGHILKNIMPGNFIYRGGLSFSKPGQRSHTNDGPDGIDYHIHDDHEAFIIIQGTGQMEVNKNIFDVFPGDIIIIDPGEDHHLISSSDSPIVTVYCHAGPEKKSKWP